MEKNIRQGIKTSYSVSDFTYKKLQNASESCSSSIQDILKIVMARYVRKMHRHLIAEDNVISYNKYGQQGFKRIYLRWNAKEYNIILQLKYNTRYGTSYMFEKAIENCLSRIVMALLRKKNKTKLISKQFFQNLFMRLDKFFVFWPNIDINSKVLPFFELHLDYTSY